MHCIPSQMILQVNHSLLTSPVVISAVSLRTWSLAVRAMALLVQPMVRVPPQAPSPPSSLPVGPPQAAPAPALLSPPSPPSCSHSHHLCLHLPLHLPRQWLAGHLHLLLSQSHQPNLPNTINPQSHLECWPPRNAASSPAGLVHHLLLMLLFLHQVSLLLHYLSSNLLTSQPAENLRKPVLLFK